MVDRNIEKKKKKAQKRKTPPILTKRSQTTKDHTAGPISRGAERNEGKWKGLREGTKPQKALPKTESVIPKAPTPKKEIDPERTPTCPNKDNKKKARESKERTACYQGHGKKRWSTGAINKPSKNRKYAENGRVAPFVSGGGGGGGGGRGGKQELLKNQDEAQCTLTKEDRPQQKVVEKTR